MGGSTICGPISLCCTAVLGLLLIILGLTYFDSQLTSKTTEDFYVDDSEDDPENSALVETLTGHRKWTTAAPNGKSSTWSKSPTNIVHYIKIYKTQPLEETDQLCYLECVSLLSVIENLKPNQIYVHTNYPDFWPFDTCNDVIKIWSVPIQMRYRQRTFLTAGKRVTAVHHQADMLKLEVLIEYGGIVLDMDVFFMHGHRVGKALKRHECMTSREGPNMMNAGFLACHKGAKYPALVLDYYAKDYRHMNVTDWTYNSGQIPWQIYNSSAVLRKKIFVDRTISDNPPGWENEKVLSDRGKVDWRKKVAYQSFYHDCNFGPANVRGSRTSFGEILRWILKIDAK